MLLLVFLGVASVGLLLLGVAAVGVVFLLLRPAPLANTVARMQPPPVEEQEPTVSQGAPTPEPTSVPQVPPPLTPHPDRNGKAPSKTPRSPLSSEGGPIWIVHPDPLPEPIPEPRNPGHEIPLSHHIRPGLIFPTTPSRFAAVLEGDPRSATCIVWDLHKMEPAGSLSFRAAVPFPTLSPDGKFFATRPITPLPSVQVWSVADGQTVSMQIDDRRSITDVADFVGPDRLLTVVHVGGIRGQEHLFRLWDSRTGERLHEFTGHGFDEWNVYAFSPGRHYLATVAGEVRQRRVWIYDLTACVPAGTITLPEANGMGELTCQALAFSRDGKELAGLFQEAGRLRLISWDLNTGGQVDFDRHIEADFSVITRDFQNNPVRLEWLPQRNGWLAYGEALIDNPSGAVLYTLPRDRSDPDVARRVLTESYVAVLGGEPEARALVLERLPQDQIEAERRKARASLGLP